MPGLPRVLIVDYDPQALRALRDLLIETGYQVDTAKDGIAAMASFKQNHPAVVLLEAMIPKKHGFEVCQEIKKTPEGRATPVIIMTAVYKGRKYRTQAMHVHGCDEYVERPCTPETLLEIVTRFVPPGTVARAMAVGGAQPSPSSPPPTTERRGEVIPFPMERSSYTLPDIDDETEREIMSKLDEILPDTPIFDEKGFGMDAASSEADSKVVDFEMGTEEDTADEVKVAEAEAQEPAWPQPEPETPRPTRAPASRKPPMAMDPEDVMKLTRPKKRPRQGVVQAPAAFPISRPII